VSVFSATDSLVKSKEGHIFNVNKESTKLALPSSGQHLFTFSEKQQLNETAK
jgi:hypothetical protein